MIYKEEKDRGTTGIYALGGKTITAVYQGSQLVWQLGGCCFSTGPWLNPLPWKNEDGWKNTP